MTATANSKLFHIDFTTGSPYRRQGHAHAPLWRRSFAGIWESKYNPPAVGQVSDQSLRPSLEAVQNWQVLPKNLARRSRPVNPTACPGASSAEQFSNRQNSNRSNCELRQRSLTLVFRPKAASKSSLISFLTPDSTTTCNVYPSPIHFRTISAGLNANWAFQRLANRFRKRQSVGTDTPPRDHPAPSVVNLAAPRAREKIVQVLYHLFSKRPVELTESTRLRRPTALLAAAV